jgi:hypothetical protein
MWLVVLMLASWGGSSIDRTSNAFGSSRRCSLVLARRQVETTNRSTGETRAQERPHSHFPDGF